MEGEDHGQPAKIEKDWKLRCTDTLFEMPTDHPVVCLVHKKTNELAYFDVNLNRFLSQQEAFDVMNGFHT